MADHDAHLYGKTAGINMLAAIQPPAKAPVEAPKAAPSRAPTPVTARQPAPRNPNAGFSQAPLIGDKQKIAKPPVHKIAPTERPQRQSADTTAGISSSLAALADELHPVKKRR